MEIEYIGIIGIAVTILIAIVSFIFKGKKNKWPIIISLIILPIVACALCIILPNYEYIREKIHTTKEDASSYPVEATSDINNNTEPESIETTTSLIYSAPQDYYNENGIITNGAFGCSEFVKFDVPQEKYIELDRSQFSCRFYETNLRFIDETTGNIIENCCVTVNVPAAENKKRGHYHGLFRTYHYTDEIRTYFQDGLYCFYVEIEGESHSYKSDYVHINHDGYYEIKVTPHSATFFNN